MPRKSYPSDKPDYRRKKKLGQIAPRARARSKSAAPLAPPAPRDYSGFTRARGAAPEPEAAPLPTLGDLASQEAAELRAVAGGTCPSCKRPHGDDGRHCEHCGVSLRNECPQCKRPMRDGQLFCVDCGSRAPSAPAAEPKKETALVPVEDAPPATIEWDADDLFFVSAAVDAALVKMDGDLLEDRERSRINKRAADVANKHFRVGGKWKEEIKLGMAIAGALFPTMYIYYVIAPHEKKKAEQEKTDAATEKTK